MFGLTYHLIAISRYHPSKNGTLSQCCFNVGSVSKTVAYHLNNIGLVFRSNRMAHTFTVYFIIFFNFLCIPTPQIIDFHFVPLDMKGCICHFAKWQIHPFISKGTICEPTRLTLTARESTFDVRI